MRLPLHCGGCAGRHSSPSHVELLDASGRSVRQWLMPQGVERESITIEEASGLCMLRWDGGQVRVSIGR